MAEYDDLATLSSIDPSIVMQTLKDRHVADKVYTKNGAVLVAINPYKAINLYTDAHLQKYKESMALETEAPHIFAVAATTHRSLISEGKNQAVIISGESGAGKTESARFVLQYLRFVSNATQDLEQRIHTSQPLTEAFGCAKTVRNDNRCARVRVERLIGTRTSALVPVLTRFMPCDACNMRASQFALRQVHQAVLRQIRKDPGCRPLHLPPREVARDPHRAGRAGVPHLLQPAAWPAG